MTESRRPESDELLARMLLRGVENMQLGVCVTDPDGRILYVNAAEARLHGFTRDELIGRDVAVFSPTGKRRAIPRDELRRFKTWTRETGNRRKDGTLFTAQLLSDVVSDADGEPLGIVTTCEDVSPRKAAEAALLSAQERLERKVIDRTQALQEANAALHAEIADHERISDELRASEGRYRRLFERNLAGVYRAAADGTILEANDALARMLGWDAAAAITGVSFTALAADPVEARAFLARVREKGSLTSQERELRTRDRRAVWVLETVSFLDANSAAPVFEGTLLDITARKRAEEQLVHDAFHDALTGLPNRALFLDRLVVVAHRAQRRKSAFAVLFVDLDRFKLVNDSLGHAAGDRLLKTVASRLAAAVRAEDTVARLGGDEFIVLLDEVGEIGEAMRSAERLLTALSAPVDVGGQEVFPSASIGIASSASGFQRPEDLLRDADTAMYRAKATGRGRYEVFDERMRTRVQEALELETALRHAVERGELRVHYQPIVELATGRFTGFEALLRWEHPQRGLLNPTSFVPLAEETGLILPIGQWVLERACRQLADWRRRRPAGERLGMSVNISSRQLAQPDLVDRVRDVLRETGLEPAALTLEITESILIDDPSGAAALLERLRTLGVGLSIDDFGTGYSSLGYLHRLPVGTLKIDQSFVASMHESGRTTEILRTIVDLAATLDLDLIAEGVETDAQRDGLRALNCGFAQGFLFATPQDEAAVERLLGLA